MNTAKSRDVWLVVLLAGILFGFGISQATADRTNSQNSNYAFAVSSGPELQLLMRQDQIPAQGKSLVCDQILNFASASIGLNCRATIKGLAAVTSR